MERVDVALARYRRAIGLVGTDTAVLAALAREDGREGDMPWAYVEWLGIRAREEVQAMGKGD